LLDRIDIHVEVPLVDFKELTPDAITGESSAVIRALVDALSESAFKRLIEVGTAH